MKRTIRTNLKSENILPQINLRFELDKNLGPLIDVAEAVSFQVSLLNYKQMHLKKIGS